MTNQPTKPEMREIKEFIRDYGQLSHTWLQRKFALSMEAAKEMRKQLEEKFT